MRRLPSLESSLCSLAQYGYLCRVSPSFYNNDSNWLGIVNPSSGLDDIVSYLFQKKCSAAALCRFLFSSQFKTTRPD